MIEYQAQYKRAADLIHKGLAVESLGEISNLTIEYFGGSTIDNAIA